LNGLRASAERELGAFMKAVTDSFGPAEAMLAADDWIQELDSIEALPEVGAYDWRSLTIAAASRLAARVITRSGYKKIRPIPSSNCPGSEPLA
jgi:hypothetical protein